MRIASVSGFAFLGLLAGSAWAVPRTFVASYGKDTNPCTVGKPCRTFAAAIAATDINGQVIAVDSAGYGPVTLTSDGISIIGAPGVHAAITTTGNTDAVTLNGPTNGTIVLRNLYITSDGTGSTTEGIVVNSGIALTIDHCFISSFPSTAIKIQPANSALVWITDTVIQQADVGISIGGPGVPLVTVDRCRIGGTRFGVWSIGQAVLTFRNTVIDYGSQFGLFASGGSSTKIGIENSSFSNCPTAVYVTNTILSAQNVTITSSGDGLVASSGAKVSIDSCILSGNYIAVQVYGDAGIANSTISDNTTGVSVSSGAARLTRNTITRNGTGISVVGGSAYSTGDNLVDGNATDLSGTISPATKM